MEAAKRQLTASRQQYMRVRAGPGEKQAQEMRIISHDVYMQSVKLFNETLNKPCNTIPAFFLGYREKSEDD